MACNKKNQRFLGKAILSLFLGMVLISCASTNTSVQKKEGALVTEQKLPEYASEYWNNGKPKTIMTGILYNDHGIIKVDSGHSEIYFENGKIKELNDWKDKQGITSKQWNENGVLIKDLDFPRSCTEYWNNGKIKQKLEGIIYKNDQDIIRVDSGRSEIYFENGKIKERNDWKDKRPVASKQWNEDGVLIIDMDFQKSCTEYWDNGKIKQKGTGILYRKEDANICSVDSGRSEIYFESGKIKEQSDWKDKQPVASKQWNEDGTLIKEVVLPNYFKEYWSNGKSKAILTGLLYKDNHGVIEVDSGHSEIYFENGKIKEENDWKDKWVVANKQWNENGLLIMNLDFQKSCTEYWDNGKIKKKLEGALYRKDDLNICEVDSGHSEVYFENGKIYQKNDWNNKQLVTQKEWNENGILIKEIDFPKYYKEYWNSGKPKNAITGNLYINNQDNFALDSGREEWYSESGKILEQIDWNNKHPITIKKWNEKGTLILEFDFQKTCIEYWDNGKIKQKGVGILYRADSTNNCSVDSGHSEVYFENGKIYQKNYWKDKLFTANKQWNENGVLVKEIDFPKYFKAYYDNGKIKAEITELYLASPTIVGSENGYKKEYYENGQIMEHANYKEKEAYSYKKWNENGTLTREWDIPAGYLKDYNENGTIQREIKGFKGFTDKKRALIENGYQIFYFDNGQPQFHEQYKGEKIISEKMWYENGAVKKEGDASKGFHKEYFLNGKISREVSGKFYYDNKDIILEKGSDRRWNKNGKLILEHISQKYAKLFSDNGTLIKELKGTLYYDDQKNVQVQDGSEKDFYDNGKLAVHRIYKQKRLVSKTEWYTNGNMGISVEMPNRYRKFYENGKIKDEATGTIVEENGGFKIKDGVYNEYDPNGKITYSATYKNFQIISEKK